MYLKTIILHERIKSNSIKMYSENPLGMNDLYVKTVTNYIQQNLPEIVTVPTLI